VFWKYRPITCFDSIWIVDCMCIEDIRKLTRILFHVSPIKILSGELKAMENVAGTVVSYFYLTEFLTIVYCRLTRHIVFITRRWLVVSATQLTRCWILTSLLTPHLISVSDQERKPDTAVAVCDKWAICVHLKILVKNLWFICGIWVCSGAEIRDCCLLSSNN
jgi:hypothetical protein